MSRSSFDFDVISGPVQPRPAPKPAPKPGVQTQESAPASSPPAK